jgi:hypothetical protein
MMSTQRLNAVEVRLGARLSSSVIYLKDTASNRIGKIHSAIHDLISSILSSEFLRSHSPSGPSPGERRIPWTYIGRTFALLMTTAFAAASLFYSKSAADDARKQLILAQVSFCESSTFPPQPRPQVCNDVGAAILNGFSGLNPFNAPFYRNNCLEASIPQFQIPMLRYFIVDIVGGPVIKGVVLIFGLAFLAAWGYDRGFGSGLRPRQRRTVCIITLLYAVIILSPYWYSKFADEEEAVCFIQPVERVRAEGVGPGF